MFQHAALQRSICWSNISVERATAVAPKEFLSNFVLSGTAEFTVWGSLTFKP